MNRKSLLIGLSSLIACSPAIANDIVDHNKIIIEQQPYTVEVCRDVQQSGDKTGDMLKGAIIGGILGNNIKGEQDGGAIGAVLGGMLGHSNSDASSGTKRVCTSETRYKETERTVYSHSTIRFIHEGMSYTLRFQK